MNEKDELEIKQEEEIGETLTPSEDSVEEQQTELDENEFETVEEDIEQIAEEEVQPQMFSQEQLNEIVGRTRVEAREKALRSFLERYGVDTEDELNDIFGKGQAYGILNDNYNSMNDDYTSLRIENALLKTKIDPARWEDAKFILSGKGLDINEENIMLELATHPEWLSNQVLEQEGTVQTPIQQQTLKPLSVDMVEQMVNKPKVEKPQPSTIKKFGSNVPQAEPQNEDSLINKFFFGM